MSIPSINIHHVKSVKIENKTRECYGWISIKIVHTNGLIRYGADTEEEYELDLTLFPDVTELKVGIPMDMVDMPVLVEVVPTITD
jgi:hypothetical protein